MEETKKLTLSEQESKSHQSIYKRIKQSMVTILENQQKCDEFLIKRGQLNEEQAQEIYKICVKYSQSDKKLDQLSFSCILKYLSAIQQGYQIDEIEDIFELPELKPPILSKRQTTSNENQQQQLQKDQDNKQQSNKQENENENKNNNDKQQKEEEKQEEQVLIRHHRSETFGVQKDSPLIKQLNEENNTDTLNNNNQESESESQEQDEPCFGMSNKKKKNKKNKKGKKSKKNSEDLEKKAEDEKKMEELIQNQEKQKEEQLKKLETIKERLSSQKEQIESEINLEQQEENKNDEEEILKFEKLQQQKNQIGQQLSGDSLGLNDSSINESGIGGLISSRIQNDNANQLQIALQQLNQNYENNQLYMKYDQIQVVNYQEKKDSMFSKTYITYTIKTHLKNSKKEYFVSKRFNEFDELDQYFHSNESYQDSIIPKLPDKSIGSQITSLLGYDNQNFLEQRKVELEIYLKNIVEDELLSNDQVLEGFLTDQGFEIPKNTQNYIQSTLNNVIDKIQNSKFQDLKDEYQSYIKTYWDSYTQNPDEGDSELQEIQVQLQKLKHYEQFLVGIRNFAQNQIKCQQQQIQVINGLSHIMPEKEDSANIQSLKHIIQETQEQYFKDDKIIESRQQLVYFIKKQLSCIYGLKQKYNELLSMIFEVQYYQQLLNSKLNSGNIADKPKLQSKLKKQEEHKNNIKKIYLQALKKFLGFMDINIQKTLSCVKETEIQQWNKFNV